MFCPALVVTKFGELVFHINLYGHGKQDQSKKKHPGVIVAMRPDRAETIEGDPR